MERPSHILFDRHSPVSRAPFMALAIGLELATVCLFVYGLKEGVIKYAPPIIDFVPVKSDPLPRTPPPPLPPERRVPITEVPIPTFDYPRHDADSGPQAHLPPQPPTQPRTETVDRPVVSITATHTVPPYPPVARRLGAEGVVTLRLTVGGDGRVSAAEIVTSAGREDLDQAARDWIIAHWRYRPALKDGDPTVAQVLASVTYSLKNQP